MGIQDALRRAVAEDPSLAEQYPELASVVAKNEAEAAKDLGNKAFSEKRYSLHFHHLAYARLTLAVIKGSNRRNALFLPVTALTII